MNKILKVYRKVVRFIIYLPLNLLVLFIILLAFLVVPIVYCFDENYTYKSLIDAIIYAVKGE